MAEHYYVGAYWSNRRETVAECGERAATLLRGLGGCDGIFTHWFRLGRSRKDALRHEVLPKEEVLRTLFEQGRNRRDFSRSVIENLGFRVALWNGGEDHEAVGFGMTCGGYASTPKVWIPNSCVIDLPGPGSTSERLLEVGALTCIVQAVVAAVEPDWAVVDSDAHRELGPRVPPGVPQVGWLTYLSARYGRVPLLPSPSRVVVLDGLGSLAIATDDRLSAASAAHIGTAERIRKELERAGLLRRLG